MSLSSCSINDRFSGASKSSEYFSISDDLLDILLLHVFLVLRFPNQPSQCSFPSHSISYCCTMHNQIKHSLKSSTWQLKLEYKVTISEQYKKHSPAGPVPRKRPGYWPPFQQSYVWCHPFPSISVIFESKLFFLHVSGTWCLTFMLMSHVNPCWRMHSLKIRWSPMVNISLAYFLFKNTFSPRQLSS